MLYDKEQVLKFLPHRDPFLFIDSVESIKGPDGAEGPEGEVVISAKDLVGYEVVANFHARKELSIFEGHFPGNPILPGVVQVEMMGQAACFTVTKLYADPFDAEMSVALMGVTNAKFRKPVVPGMDLVVKTICTKSRGAVMSYDCQIFESGNLMSESSVLATVKL